MSLGPAASRGETVVREANAADAPAIDQLGAEPLLVGPQVDAGRGEHALDERALVGGVGTHGQIRRNVSVLPGLVLRAQSRIRAEGVAERQTLAPEVASRHGEVEMVCCPEQARVGEPVEPMRVRAVGVVDVARALRGVRTWRAPP